MKKLVETNSVSGNQETIKKNLFQAVAKPLFVKGRGSSNFDDPEVNGLYKNTGGQCFGYCKGVYDILQPDEFLDTVCEALEAEGNGMVSPDNLIYKEFRGGGIISIKAPLKKMVVRSELKANADMDDIIDMYLDFTTAFDGRTASKLSIFTERLVCLNGMTTKHREIGKNFKHTKNANLRAKQYATTIVKTLENLEAYTEFMNRLATVQLDEKQKNDLIKEITGYDVVKNKELVKQQLEVEKLRTSSDEKIKNAMHYKTFDTFTNLMESLEIEFNRTGDTAYGLLQGITHFSNHNMSGNTEGEEFIKYDRGVLINDKAQDVISKLVL